MAPEAAQPLLANAERHVDTAGLSYGTDAPAALAEAVEVEPRDTQGTFQRNLGTLDAFAIIISIVIGSGIFTSPGSIDTNVPSPGLALVIWLVGGMLAWTGASTMAELGTAIPGEGTYSEFHYFEATFTDIMFRRCPALFEVHLRRHLGSSGRVDMGRGYHAGDAGHPLYSVCREHLLRCWSDRPG